MKLILTCEHGGNHIPKEYESYFKNKKNVLNSHLGYDLGALDIFKTLAPLANYAHYSETSRLLIELNRSLHHPNLFSTITKPLAKDLKAEIISTFYHPYRIAVASKIRDYIKYNEWVVHLSIHSFTPVFKNTERNCDMGLLYDPKRKLEKQFCKQLKSSLNAKDVNLNIRYNYPYLGKSDGFTTYLRKTFPKHYMGIELEVNQKFSDTNIISSHIKEVLYQSLREQFKSCF
ncbi:N-formylglutamate amidohydrolase [Mariniflexile ostreae]|uniref:N-formylglutamate amidohydrolase n=1 Tax=Mariniflexile ostreae TaxID=1520892 RepID=A0ABV5F7X4_9FLAO